MAGGALAATAAASPQPCASLHTCHTTPVQILSAFAFFLRLLLIDVGIRPSPKATLSHGLSCPTALSPPACPAALQAGMPTQTVSFASASTLRAPHFAHNRPRHQHMSLAPTPLPSPFPQLSLLTFPACRTPCRLCRLPHATPPPIPPYYCSAHFQANPLCTHPPHKPPMPCPTRQPAHLPASSSVFLFFWVLFLSGACNRERSYQGRGWGRGRAMADMLLTDKLMPSDARGMRSRPNHRNDDAAY